MNTEGEVKANARILTATCLNDLLRYVPSPGEVVRVKIPLKTKLSELHKMVECAESKNYELLDDLPGTGFSWKTRLEWKLTEIDDMTEELDNGLDKLLKTRAAVSKGEQAGK